MRIIGRDELLKTKNSNTIVVYGCGLSINSIGKKQRSILSKFDSIGFNWFCKSDIPTTFYLLREQCSNEKRIDQGETTKDLLRLLSKREACYIIAKMESSNKLFKEGVIDKIDKNGVILDDVPCQSRPKRFLNHIDKDIFKEGLYHGRNTLFSVMHFVHFMGYKRIIFAGVDLNDSKYFWLGNKRRHTVKKKVTHRHKTADDTISLIRMYNAKYDAKLMTINPKSLLAKRISVFSFK